MTSLEFSTPSKQQPQYHNDNDYFNDDLARVDSNEENYQDFNNVNTFSSASKVNQIKKSRNGNTPLRVSFNNINSNNSGNEYDNIFKHEDASTTNQTHHVWKQKVQMKNLSKEDFDTVDQQCCNSDSSSAAPSSVVSVSKMRGWLDDFGKKHKEHYEKTSAHIGQKPDNVSLTKPHRRPKSNAASQQQQATTMVVIDGGRMASSGTTSSGGPDRESSKRKGHRAGPTKTPVKLVTSSFNKADVEATNNGYASVEKLSAWLADNPTSSKKKITHLRKGMNVIRKSRVFEKNTNIVIDEDIISSGSVSEKREVFRNDDSNNNAAQEETHSISVTNQRQWLQNAFRKDTPEEEGGHDESKSCVSVSDRQQWLNGAFRREGYASTEINTSSSRLSNMSSAAKQKWRQRSTSRSSLSSSAIAAASPLRPASTSSSSYRLNNSSVARGDLDERHSSYDDKPAVAVDTKTALKNKWRQKVAARLDEETTQVEHRGEMNNQHETRVSDSQQDGRSTLKDQWRRKQAMVKANHTNTDMKYDGGDVNPAASNDQEQEEEEEKEVDFKAARELLVNRSKANGNPVKVWGKVERRKAKFEKLEKDMLKGTGEKGLLKVSWKDSSEQAAGGSYQKTFVEDIAAKKSFDDLP